MWIYNQIMSLAFMNMLSLQVRVAPDRGLKCFFFNIIIIMFLFQHYLYFKVLTIIIFDNYVPFLWQYLIWMFTSLISNNISIDITHAFPQNTLYEAIVYHTTHNQLNESWQNKQISAIIVASHSCHIKLFSVCINQSDHVSFCRMK